MVRRDLIQALKLEPRIMRYELSAYEWSGIEPMLRRSRRRGADDWYIRRAHV